MSTELTNLVVDVVGWIGALSLLLAYALISSDKLKWDDQSYQLLNLVGSFSLMVNTGYEGAYPATFLNIVWGAIAAVALWRLLRIPNSEPIDRPNP